LPHAKMLRAIELLPETGGRNRFVLAHWRTTAAVRGAVCRSIQMKAAFGAGKKS